MPFLSYCNCYDFQYNVEKKSWKSTYLSCYQSFGESFNSSLLIMVISVGFLVDLYQLRISLSFIIFWAFSSWMGIGFSQMLFDTYWDYHFCSLFYSYCELYCFIVWILNQLCIPIHLLLLPCPVVTVMDMYSNSSLRRIWFVQGLTPLRNKGLGHIMK